MYKFFNKLFGWDYVYWKNAVDNGIARVHVTPNGVVYYYRYFNTGVIDVVANPNEVLWLTCKPNKYGFN